MLSDRFVILSNMFDETRTVLSRAREAAGLRQVDASRVLGLSRGTWNLYESGRVVPSERRTWEVLSDLARGERASGRPRLLVTFALFGQRVLSWRGGILVLSAIGDAAMLVDELETCRLERVLVLPVWPSALEELVRDDRERGGEGCAITFPDERVGFGDLVREVFLELAASSLIWCHESFESFGEDALPTPGRVS